MKSAEHHAAAAKAQLEQAQAETAELREALRRNGAAEAVEQAAMAAKIADAQREAQQSKAEAMNQTKLCEQAAAEAARLSAGAAEVQSLKNQRALELVKVKLDLNHATETQLQVTVP